MNASMLKLAPSTIDYKWLDRHSTYHVACLKQLAEGLKVHQQLIEDFLGRD